MSVWIDEPLEMIGVEHAHIFERPTPRDPVLAFHWRCILCGEVMVAPGEQYVTIPIRRA